ncbi:hypothetical protein [Pseudoalteromonas lipolytica]
MKYTPTLLVCAGLVCAGLIAVLYASFSRDSHPFTETAYSNDLLYHDDIQFIANSLLTSDKTTKSDDYEQLIIKGFDTLIQHPEFYEVKLDFYACDNTKCLTQISVPIKTSEHELAILKSEILFSILAELPSRKNVVTTVDNDNAKLFRVISALD